GRRDLPRDPGQPHLPCHLAPQLPGRLRGTRPDQRRPHRRGGLACAHHALGRRRSAVPLRLGAGIGRWVPETATVTARGWNCPAGAGGTPAAPTTPCAASTW